MVRAILDGRKTQTRRVVKPQPPHSCRYTINGAGTHALCFGPNGECVPPTGRSTDHRLPCPYGVPGDTLWVRETWGLHDTEPSDGPERAHVYYRATDGKRHDLRYQFWRPSIHMPRWACRLTLAVTAVRVQRLHEITEADAIAEGVDAVSQVEVPRNGTMSRRADFSQLWDRINVNRHPWASNPWVWVVTFEPEVRS